MTANDGPEHLVITVHGIRTDGTWANQLRTLLEAKDSRIRILHYHYGYFSVLAFFVPLLRWIRVFQFRRELVKLSRWTGITRVDIVCHSFGTYIVAKALRWTASELLPPIHTVILASTVLKTNFDWSSLFQRGKVHRVINDCATEDAILILANFLVVGTGMAGRVGFYGLVGERLVNRFHTGGHSRYFADDDFMARLWVPLLTSDAAVERVDTRRNKTDLHGFKIFALNNLDFVKVTAYIAIPATFVYGQIQERRTAHAIALATTASSLLDREDEFKMQGLMIALEAMKYRATPFGDRVLERALSIFPARPDVVDVGFRIGHVAVARSGTWAVFEQDDGTTVAIDLATGMSGKPLSHDLPVDRLAISATGSKAFAAGPTGDGSVWSTATGDQRVPILHDGPVLAAAFNPEGTRLTTIALLGFGSGVDAYQWNVDDGKQILSTGLEAGPVTAAAISDDGRLVVTFSPDTLAGPEIDPLLRPVGGVAVWEAASGKELAWFATDAAMQAVAISPDGEWVAAADERGNIRIWSIRGGAPSAMIRRKTAVVSIEFGRQDSLLKRPETMTVAEAASDTQVQAAFDEGRSFFPSAPFLTVRSKRTITLYEIPTGRELSSLVHDTDIADAVAGPLGRTVWSVSDGVLHVWRPFPRAWAIRNEALILAAALSQNAKSIVALGNDGRWRAWEQSTGIAIGTVNPLSFLMRGGLLTALDRGAVSLATRAAIVIGVVDEPAAGRLLVWNGATGEQLGESKESATITSVAASGDGAYFAFSTDDDVIKVVENASLNVAARFKSAAKVTALSFSSDGANLAAGNSSGVVAVWSLPTGNQSTLRMFSSEIVAVSMNADGSWLAASSAAGEVDVVETATGTIRTSVARSLPVATMTFGERPLLALANPEQIEILDVDSGSTIAMEAAPEQPRALMFTPDDHRLLVVQAHEIRSWLYQPAARVAEACERMTRTFMESEWQSFDIGSSYEPACGQVIPRRVRITDRVRP
jgi:WD40 repeat protein